MIQHKLKIEKEEYVFSIDKENDLYKLKEVSTNNVLSFKDKKHLISFINFWTDMIDKQVVDDDAK